MNPGYSGGEYVYQGVGPGFPANQGSDDSNSAHAETQSAAQDILQSFPYLRHGFGQGGFPQVVCTTSQQQNFNSYKGPYQENFLQIPVINPATRQFPPYLPTQTHVTQGQLPPFSSIPKIRSQLSHAYTTQIPQTSILQSASYQQAMPHTAVSYPTKDALTTSHVLLTNPDMSNSMFTGTSSEALYTTPVKKEFQLSYSASDFAPSETTKSSEQSFSNTALASNKSAELAEQSAAASFESLLEASNVVSQANNSSETSSLNREDKKSSADEAAAGIDEASVTNSDNAVDESEPQEDNNSSVAQNRCDTSKSFYSSRKRDKRGTIRFILKGRLHKGVTRHPKQILSELVDSEEFLFDNIVYNYPPDESEMEMSSAELPNTSEAANAKKMRYMEPSLADIRAGAMSIRDDDGDENEDINDDDFDKKTDDYDADESFTNNNIQFASNDANVKENWYSAAMNRFAEISKDDTFEEEAPLSIKKGGRSDPENPFAMTSPSFSESAAKALMTTTVSSTATYVMISIMSIGSREKLIPKIISSKAAEGGIVSVINPITKEDKTKKSKGKSISTDCDMKLEATPIMSKLRRDKKDDNNDTEETDMEIDRLDINIKIDDDQYVSHGDTKRWQCKICPKSYTTKHNLVAHILDHSGVKPHLCLVCGKYFKQLSHLNTHMLTHDNVKPHVCLVCNKGFTQISHLKRHETVHLESKPYICEICNRGFAYPSELRLHMEKHTQSKEKCLECDKEFMNAKELRAHLIEENHCNDLTCKHCERVFKFPSQLKDHMFTHAGSRPYICSECGMDFMKEHHLRAHQFTHTGLRPFLCPHCHRSFNQKANMMRHMLIHNAQRAYRCEVCSKTFTQPQTLKAHMVVHADKKPYSCKFCGKQFGRLHNLQGHLHIHTDSKPYMCCICQASFTLKGNLNRHKKVKHGLNESTENMEEDAVNFLSSMSGRVNDSSADTDPEGDSRDGMTSPDSKSPKKGRKSVPRKHVSRKMLGKKESEAGNEGDNLSDTEENRNAISYSDEERENEERMKIVSSKYFEATDCESGGKSGRKGKNEEEEGEETLYDDGEDDSNRGEEEEHDEDSGKIDENENGIGSQARGKIKEEPEPERRSTRKRKKREVYSDEFEQGFDDEEEVEQRRGQRSGKKGAKLDSIIATKFKKT